MRREPAQRSADPARPTARPTDERQRHAEAVIEPDVNGRAFRPWWAVRTRLDALLAGGLIDRDAHDRANRLRADCERMARTGSSSMARFDMPRIAPRAGSVAETTIDAAGRVARVRARMGAADFALVYVIAVDDLSWRELGRRMGCHDTTARQRAAKAIMRLAGR